MGKFDPMKYQDPADVVLRSPRYSGPESPDQYHARIRTLLEKRKDQVLYRLDDPTLTQPRRDSLVAQYREIKADIESIRLDARESLYAELERKYA